MARRAEKLADPGTPDDVTEGRPPNHALDDGDRLQPPSRDRLSPARGIILGLLLGAAAWALLAIILF